MLLALMLLVGAQDRDRVTPVGAQILADVPCKATHDDGEVVVCARREADRYRVPLVQSANPDNSVPLRTARLLEDHGRPCAETAFLVNCGGMVGVTVTAGAKGVHLVERERAP